MHQDIIRALSPVSDDELRRLADAATKGPWLRTADGESVMVNWRGPTGNMLPECWKRGGHPRIVAKAAGENRFADMEYIAAANPVTVINLINRAQETSLLIDLLRRFRDYVVSDGRWSGGAHHSPLWAEVAGVLERNGNND